MCINWILGLFCAILSANSLISSGATSGLSVNTLIGSSEKTFKSSTNNSIVPVSILTLKTSSVLLKDYYDYSILFLIFPIPYLDLHILK